MHTHIDVERQRNSSYQTLASHLVTVMYSRDNLPEEVSRLSLAELTPLADVVIQLPFAGVLHHDDNLVLILEHCANRDGKNRPRL